MLPQLGKWYVVARDPDGVLEQLEPLLPLGGFVVEEESLQFVEFRHIC